MQLVSQFPPLLLGGSCARRSHWLVSYIVFFFSCNSSTFLCKPFSFSLFFHRSSNDLYLVCEMHLRVLSLREAVVPGNPRSATSPLGAGFMPSGTIGDLLRLVHMAAETCWMDMEPEAVCRLLLEAALLCLSPCGNLSLYCHCVSCAVELPDRKSVV